MNKAQILSMLKAKIGTTDTRFDKTLENFIEYKNLSSVADEELNLDQYTDDLKWQMSQAIGLANHEIAEARRTWDASNSQNTPEQPQSQMSDEIKAILAQQNEQIAVLVKELNGYKSKTAIDALRKSLVDEGSGLKANPKLWELAVNGVSVDETSTKEGLIASVKQSYESLQKSVFGDGQSPYGVTAPDDPAAQTKATLDEFFKDKF